MSLSHEELIERGVKWLKGTKQCRVVAREPVLTHFLEVPDVIGFTFDNSFQVECKASRADFRQDWKKPSRTHPFLLLARYNFYMVPPNLVKPEEVPEDWGLLYCHPKIVRVVKYPSYIVRTENVIKREREFLFFIASWGRNLVDNK